jgi:xylose dehydrogenase (NAD/NADP)
MTKLRWGLLSTANINRQLIPAVRGSARGELTAVASRDGAKARAYAEQWGLPRSFGSYEAMLASPDVDVVYLSLPNSLHAEWAIKCLEAGKHVLIEKPIAMNVGEVDAIQSAAKRTGRVAVEAFMYQHSPQILKLQELVAGGSLGRIYAVRASFTFKLAVDKDPRLDPELGGGSLWDVGCYPVSMAQLLMGGKPVEVFAAQDKGNKDVDLALLGQMKYAGGRLAQFDCGFQTPYRTYVEVLGTDASVSTRPFRPDVNYAGETTLTINRGDTQEVVSVPNPPLYNGEVEDLHDAILNGSPTRLSLAASRDHVATICALYDSVRSGQPVKLA